MYHITLLPMNKKIKADSTVNLMEVLIEQGIYLENVCGGNGTCGKCLVMVTKGNRKDDISTEEKEIIGEEMLLKGYRLACKFKIKEDTCIIVDKKYLKKNTEKITDRGITREDKGVYGVAFDIGSTTVEGAVYNLITGEELMRKSSENPQRVYGSDIVSRLAYCRVHENGLSVLNRLIIQCCNNIIAELCKTCEISTYNRIKKITVAGNTVMSHIFANRRIEGLFSYPFKYGFEGKFIFSAEKLGLLASKEASAVIIPSIKGYVGADVLCGILISGMNRKNEINMLIDVGTNGEIVLSANGKITVCSTAAGPAFEGAGISQGMRADTGAIKSAIWKENGLKVEVIGNGKAEGIAGSAVIDVIREFLRHSKIDETGRILDSKDLKLLVKKNSDGSCVYITQNDIRQVQLAKAAIKAGVEEILEVCNVDKSELDNLYIAGVFGNSLNLDNAMEIGFFPKISKEKAVFLGNSSLSGAAKILLENDSFLESAQCLAEETEHLELALSKGFQKKFLESINF